LFFCTLHAFHPLLMRRMVTGGGLVVTIGAIVRILL
jgi:hypothetical protein